MAPMQSITKHIYAKNFNQNVDVKRRTVRKQCSLYPLARRIKMLNYYILLNSLNIHGMYKYGVDAIILSNIASR